jgi:outer membrane receptor for ferrienterochelin and colicins
VTLTATLTALGGLRLDHHAEHGVIPAPRLALRWQPGEATTLRVNAATGFRVVSLFTEDHAAVTGAREVVIAERLEPERSVSATVGLEHHVHLSGGEEELLVFGLDLFHTRFTNKIQPDYDADPDLIVYANLDGRAVTRGVSAAVQLSAPSRPYAFSVGATVQDVWSERGGRRRALEFAPRVQGVATASYTFRRAGGLTVDWTGRMVGPMALPAVPGHATRSPWFGEHHVQATATLGDGLQLFAAVKNVLDWRQPDPLVDPHDPFGPGFDTYRVYGPIQGRRLLLGTRWAAGR